MTPLTYKPRVKMQSWTPPAPPKPKRSRFYIWAVLGWLAATAIGVAWFSDGSESAQADNATPLRKELDVSRTATALANYESATTGAPPIAAPSAVSVPAPAATASTKEILPCEDFLKQASEANDNRIPMHLGRSAIDVFIGENDWAKPCRSTHRRTVALCVAIRDGAVIGLTARTVPPNLALENCLREQASKLTLQPEGTLRVIRSTLAL